MKTKNINEEVLSLIDSNPNSDLYSLIIRETNSGTEYYKVPIYEVTNMLVGTDNPEVSQVPGLSGLLANKESNADGRVALLDNNLKVKSENLTASGGGIKYMGVYNATTNTPALSDTQTDRNNGDYYVVSVLGQRADVASNASLLPGDWIIWTGSGYTHVDRTASPVTSVNGNTGSISLPFPTNTPAAGRYTGINSITVNAEGFVTAISANSTIENTGILGTSLEGTSNWVDSDNRYEVNFMASSNPTFAGFYINTPFSASIGDTLIIELDIAPISGVIQASVSSGIDLVASPRLGTTISSTQPFGPNIDFNALQFANLNNQPGTITSQSVVPNNVASFYIHIAGPYGVSRNAIFAITGIRVTLVPA